MKKKIELSIQELGYTLPSQVRTAANYIPAKEHQGLIYTSGQLPFSISLETQKSGELLCTGPLSKDASATKRKQAQQGLNLCLLNAIAAARAICSLEDLQEIIRLAIFVQSTADFHEQHLIADPVSKFAEKIFPGRHTRTTIGVIDLPLNSTVEMEVIFAVHR